MWVKAQTSARHSMPSLIFPCVTPETGVFAWRRILSEGSFVKSSTDPVPQGGFGGSRELNGPDPCSGLCTSPPTTTRGRSRTPEGRRLCPGPPPVALPQPPEGAQEHPRQSRVSEPFKALRSPRVVSPSPQAPEPPALISSPFPFAHSVPATPTSSMPRNHAKHCPASFFA